jgi:hypothetical protein
MQSYSTAAAGSDHAFAKTTNTEVMRHYKIDGVKAGELYVVVTRKWDRKEPLIVLKFGKDELSAPDAVKEKIEAAAWPLIMKFERDAEQRRRVEAHPVKTLMLMLVDHQDFTFESMIEMLTTASKTNNRRALHLWADASDNTLIKRLGIKESELPTALIFNPAKGGTKGGKRLTDDDVTVEGLLKLTDEYFGTSGKQEL